MSYAFDDEAVQTWTPGQPFPVQVADFKGQIRAHNAAFERLIFWYVLQINFDLTQFYCTATQARANCAPGGLEDAGRFAGASMKKDHRGSQLIRLLSIPRADGTFNNDPDLMAEMIRYCEQDVRAMRAVSKSMRDLLTQELFDYHVNERINDRGVLVDVALCKAAQTYATEELDAIQQIVREVTEGAVESVRSPKMRQWVQDRVGDEALKLMETYKDGIKKYSIDKSVRANLLAFDNDEQVPPDVREVIQCADDAWASSVAKFTRLAELADIEDHRVRGAFVFAGGAATGRASSYGAQVHNFTRKCVKDPEDVRRAMVRGHDIVPQYGKRVTDVLRGMLRPAIVPRDGHTFLVADWSAIEARMNPWLSAQPSAEKVLDVFRANRDIYVREAAGIFHVPEDKVAGDQRQIGKVAILSCFGPNTQVLTDSGYKAIVEVTLADKLWDGVEWVIHQGLIAKGYRKTLNIDGAEVTPEHLIRTGETWTPASQLAMSASTLSLALATGSARLPLLQLNGIAKAHVAQTLSAFSAIAERRRIWSTITTFVKGVVRDATFALKKHRGAIEKPISNTPQFAQTTSIVGGCLIDWPLAEIVATTRMIPATSIMVGAASTFTVNGVPTKRRSFDMYLRLKAGISPIWNWIGSMLIADMSQETYASSRGQQTWLTNEKSRRCSGTSKNLKPVYDILNSGPRNRFTIKTDAGHLIVHNCGYGGGVGAFAAMGRNYGVVLPESDARRTVDAWRRANQWAVHYWQDLESAYTRAMRNKGYEVKAGRVTYLFDGQHLWYALPSGRILCYPYAKLESDGVTYAKAAWKPAADAKEWPRARLWKGLAAENICQAAANDVLRHALRQLPDVVLHVHDEIVIECPDADVEAVKARMESAMCTPPEWAQDLPLKIDLKAMKRYGKG